MCKLRMIHFYLVSVIPTLTLGSKRYNLQTTGNSLIYKFSFQCMISITKQNIRTNTLGEIKVSRIDSENYRDTTCVRQLQVQFSTCREMGQLLAGSLFTARYRILLISSTVYSIPFPLLTTDILE